MQKNSTAYRKLQETVSSIKKHLNQGRPQVGQPQVGQPQVGMILGSGLGAIADDLQDRKSIPYSEIPGFFPPSVEGHAGQLLTGRLNGVPVIILQGRFHRYEGYSMEEVVLPTRALCLLGIRCLVLTNAAGGINTRFRPGDVMLIEDHLNLTGDNPLRGPNIPELGPRFPDLTEPYNKKCLNVLREKAAELGFSVHTGVYGGLLGPAYETPAEVRMLRLLGADAVGMSTVPEAIAANHMGVSVCGLSCITNLAAGMTSEKLSHQEVIDVSRVASEKIREIITAAVPHLAGDGSH